MIVNPETERQTCMFKERSKCKL